MEKIWILAYKERFKTYENKLLAKRIGSNNLIDPRDLNILIEDKIKIYLNDELVTLPKVIFPKLGCSLDEYTIDILKTFEILGVKVINTVYDLMIVKNKYQTSLLLANNNINFIKGKLVNASSSKNHKFGYPMIIKSKVGSLGFGIYKIESENEFNNMKEQINLLDKNYNYILQEYIKEGNVDYRVMVIFGEIKYVIKTTAKNGFKANYTTGAIAEIAQVDNKIKKIIKKIYKVFKLDIMGIDLFHVKNEYIVCEINSNPGFRAYNDLTGKDFSEEIIKMLDVKID